MKKIIILSLLLLTTFSGFAQNSKHERIKAIKTAYLTDALNLTVDEAEKFWPIYNTYDDKMEDLRFNEMHKLFDQLKNDGGVDNLSEDDANKIVKKMLKIEKQMTYEREDLYKKLDGILSSKKIIKLFRAEQGFGRELLKQYREKHKMGPSKNE